MDTDDLDPPIPNDSLEDSGSEYEKSSESDVSRDEQTSHHGRGRKSTSRTQSRASSRRPRTRSEKTGSLQSEEEFDARITEEAQQWAASFEPPPSSGHIKSPPRGRRKPRKFDKRARSPTVVRAKRLKCYYNNDYRELLNVDIQDAASRVLHEDTETFQQSQMGSSIWTSVEKDIFFSALARMGRDDVRGIANRITTKSEVEVQQYILLLQQESRARAYQKTSALYTSNDLPAAMEITPECCEVLERAGDALAARQELAEKKTENNKWGESWLLTTDVCRQLNSRRRTKEGEEELEEVLPAINLLDLRRWLELPRTVFMNPGSLYGTNNWENIAEPGETPAIRATAFEDFHSLAVSITKRLVASTLFCTMSRIRAKNAQKVKHAEVDADDVEAAVSILGLKHNSEQFWISAARRNHLKVIDDEAETEDETSDDEEEEEREYPAMSYDEVENSLKGIKRSRSRSASHRARSRPLSQSSIVEPVEPSASEHQTSDSESLSSLLDEESNYPLTDASDTSISSHQSQRRNKAALRHALQEEHDNFAEASDLQASHEEELRLWAILQQVPPFENKGEPVDEDNRPQRVRDLYGKADEAGWRDYVEFWSEWEMHRKPVMEKEFVVNRERMSRKRKRAESVGSSGHDDQSDQDVDEDVMNESEDSQDQRVLEEDDGQESSLGSPVHRRNEDDHDEGDQGSKDTESASMNSHVALSDDDIVFRPRRYDRVGNSENEDSDQNVMKMEG